MTWKVHLNGGPSFVLAHEHVTLILLISLDGSTPRPFSAAKAGYRENEDLTKIREKFAFVGREWSNLQAFLSHANCEAT